MAAAAAGVARSLQLFSQSAGEARLSARARCFCWLERPALDEQGRRRLLARESWIGSHVASSTDGSPPAGQVAGYTKRSFISAFREVTGHFRPFITNSNRAVGTET